MAFCPRCRSEYREGVEVCRTCGAALVEALLPLPKRPAFIGPAIKRFIRRFAGRDATPPRLESFLLKQPPDWRHTVLASAFVIAMACFGASVWLRVAIAPAQVGSAPPATAAGAMSQWQRMSPPRVTGILLGSAATGIVGAMIARRWEWLWGLLGICVALAVHIVAIAVTYPYGKATRDPGSTLWVTWRFSTDFLRWLVLPSALACAVGGGMLARTRVNRWAVGIVTVCVAVVVLQVITSVAWRVLFKVLGPERVNEIFQPLSLPMGYLPYFFAGLWVGYLMRRSGLAWGAAIGLFLLFDVVTGAYRVWHSAPVGVLRTLAPYVE